MGAYLAHVAVDMDDLALDTGRLAAGERAIRRLT